MICGKIRTLFFSEAQYCILIWGKWRELTTLLIINQTLRTVKGQLDVKKNSIYVNNKISVHISFEVYFSENK